MGSIFLNILFVIHIIVCLGIILLILLHSGKGAGISGLFSGMVDTFDGTGIVEKNLDRITVILGSIFGITSVLLFIFQK
ncbi:MAG: preprotein translocase subunit SecG [Actinobacteria bacterium]|jgi:preprotein translocase subunit SecG|nr:preprotein translocase subunit SecG [Actinomycetota bacterium]